MKGILITNNPSVHEAYHQKIKTVFLPSASLMDVLAYTRNEIHEGYELLTHPLSGSIKPNETPYKSLLISLERGPLHFESLKIMEDSMSLAKVQLSGKATPQWTEKIKEDFMLIDFGLITSGIESMLT